MPLADHDQKVIDGFFAGLAPWEDAYKKFASLSYFAVKHEGAFVLVQARLFLNTVPSDLPLAHFQTANIRAGHFLISDLKADAQGVVGIFTDGKLICPAGELWFPPAHGGSYSAYHLPFHPEGLQNGNRLDVLTLTGARWTEYVRQPQLDWEVKAAMTPYDSIAELLLEYRLGTLRGDAANLEVVAFNVAVVDLSSTVSGTKANPAVLLADGLSPDKVTLGYRVFSQGRVVQRATIPGAAMQWERRDALQRGITEIDIPPAAVLHCISSYAGTAQHQGWLSDPSTVQNPQRSVYEAFDDKLEVLRDFLAKSQGKGRDARDLEAGVSWLLWMLGFSVAHLGGTDKTQNAPDLIATTPRGNFAVIECTTGLLKAENKLALLVDRAEALKRRLEASGNRHLHVLPVIVTSKARVEVKADLEQAEKLGVVVLTRESLEEALKRTLVLPDAEAVFAEGEQAAQAAQAKYQNAALPFAGA